MHLHTHPDSLRLGQPGPATSPDRTSLGRGSRRAQRKSAHTCGQRADSTQTVALAGNQLFFFLSGMMKRHDSRTCYIQRVSSFFFFLKYLVAHITKKLSCFPCLIVGSVLHGCRCLLAFDPFHTCPTERACPLSFPVLSRPP